MSGGQSCDGSIRVEETVVLPVGEPRVAVRVVSVSIYRASPSDPILRCVYVYGSPSCLSLSDLTMTLPVRNPGFPSPRNSNNPANP